MNTTGRVRSWAWFAAWAVGGALCVLALVSFIIVLVLLAVVIAAVAAVLLARTHTRAPDSALGVVAGAGLVLLFVGYLNRQGPGETCWQSARGGGCDQHLDPFPWLAVGMALVSVAIVAQVLRDRRTVESRNGRGI